MQVLLGHKLTMTRGEVVQPLEKAEQVSWWEAPQVQFCCFIRKVVRIGGISLVSRPKRGPGNHCLCMRWVFHSKLPCASSGYQALFCMDLGMKPGRKGPGVPYTWIRLTSACIHSINTWNVWATPPGWQKHSYCVRMKYKSLWKQLWC